MPILRPAVQSIGKRNAEANRDGYPVRHERLESGLGGEREHNRTQQPAGRAETTAERAHPTSERAETDYARGS